MTRTTAPQTTITTVTMKASQFRDLVAPVMPLADQDSTYLPILNAVSIEAHDDYLIATATDRYRLGSQRVKMAEDVSGFAALVSIRSLRSVLSIFKTTRKADPLLCITSAEGVLSVKSVGGLDVDGGFMAGSMSWALVDGQYPKVREIIATAASAEVSGPLLLNPSLLSAFGTAQKHGEPMVMRGAVGKSVFVQIGPDFIGAIMQVRSSEAAKLDADWTTFLTLAKTEVAA
jgi:DNA polymerase III beta subunit, central domain